VEEDAKLTEAVEELGTKDWVRVAAMVRGRTNQQRRYRWVMNLDPNVTLGKWTVEEDAKLTDAVKEHGVNNWAAIAALVPGRKNSLCPQRWAKLEDRHLAKTQS
jgi:myb proto-oncogene protein